MVKYTSIFPNPNPRQHHYVGTAPGKGRGNNFVHHMFKDTVLNIKLTLNFDPRCPSRLKNIFGGGVAVGADL